ncbi:hypothetical protein [Metabacillus iocasae]|uniref:DUF3813 domain-containing protein n=1 Tax=Priestia iocasae TaxID=2291674 RepID=A0ABS2QTJ4_9BACI|nr:hypothetical protein [Metabacillus iocasae]MBM7702608.1 hypothetical protein [Metabacillus iocasae]
MRKSFFEQAKGAVARLTDAVTQSSKEHREEMGSFEHVHDKKANHKDHHDSAKNHNGQLDMSNKMLTAAMASASPKEQQQLKQLNHSLNHAYGTEKQGAQMSEHVHQNEQGQGQMQIAEDILNFTENQANPEEKAQVEELAQEIERKF